MADKFNDQGGVAEAVRSAESGERMLSPEKIQEVLTELVKAQEEQRKRIDNLTADNASLRAENQSLRAKVDELSRESDDLRRQVSGRTAEAPATSASSRPEQAERTESTAAQPARAESVANNEKPLTSAEVFASMGQMSVVEVSHAEATPTDGATAERPAGAHFATGERLEPKEPRVDIALDGDHHVAGEHMASKEANPDYQSKHMAPETQPASATDEIMNAEYTELPVGKHMAENTGPIDIARNKLRGLNHEPQHTTRLYTRLR